MSYLCRRKAALGNLKASFHCARFAFSLHRQPMKVLREPRRRHLLRPRAVTIDDRRRSSIKTQRWHYRAADKVLNYHSKTYRTMINYSIVKRSVNANLIEINQAKSRINQAKKEGKTPQPAVIKAIKQGKDNVDISKPASPSTGGSTEGGGTGDGE